jgi:hypothetical protein
LPQQQQTQRIRENLCTCRLKNSRISDEERERAARIPDEHKEREREQQQRGFLTNTDRKTKRERERERKKKEEETTTKLLKTLKRGKKKPPTSEQNSTLSRRVYTQEPSNCKTPSAAVATNISSQDEALKEPILVNPSELEEGGGGGGGSS